MTSRLFLGAVFAVSLLLALAFLSYTTRVAATEVISVNAYCQSEQGTMKVAQAHAKRDARQVALLLSAYKCGIAQPPRAGIVISHGIKHIDGVSIWVTKFRFADVEDEFYTYDTY